MEPLSGFEAAGGRGFYRPGGTLSAGRLADLITFALRRARAEGLIDVVVNVASTAGFESPGPAYRRWAVRRWAEAAGPDLRVAVVARPGHICADKTGMLVAAEEGLRSNIFVTEAEAVAWLDGLPAGAEPSAGV